MSRNLILRDVQCTNCNCWFRGTVEQFRDFRKGRFVFCSNKWCKLRVVDPTPKQIADRCKKIRENEPRPPQGIDTDWNVPTVDSPSNCDIQDVINDQGGKDTQ